MRLRPESSVTGASAANDIGRAKQAGAAAEKPVAMPQDAIRISSEFETLSLLQASQSTRVARVAAAVQGGSYKVDSAAVGKAIVAAVLD